jgi:beta-1,4-mannosyltransferase
MLKLQLASELASNVITIVFVLSTLFTFFIISLPRTYSPYEGETIDPRVADAVRDVLGKDTNQRDKKKPKAKTSVQIVVLGDIGRSPRMQYHAISIAKHGGRVDIIGYQG